MQESRGGIQIIIQIYQPICNSVGLQTRFQSVNELGFRYGRQRPALHGAEWPQKSDFFNRHLVSQLDEVNNERNHDAQDKDNF